MAEIYTDGAGLSSESTEEDNLLLLMNSHCMCLHICTRSCRKLIFLSEIAGYKTKNKRAMALTNDILKKWNIPLQVAQHWAVVDLLCTEASSHSFGA